VNTPTSLFSLGSRATRNLGPVEAGGTLRKSDCGDDAIAAGAAIRIALNAASASDSGLPGCCHPESNPIPGCCTSARVPIVSVGANGLVFS
jgi:hypothetical protein